MSDFKVNVTAELDTSKLQTQLKGENLKIKVSDITVDTSALQTAINTAASGIKGIKIDVDTAYIKSQLSSALSGATSSASKSGKTNIQTDFSKQFAALQKEYSSFLTTFNKSGGQSLAGFDSIKKGIESVSAAMKTLKVENASGILSNADFGKAIQTQATYLNNLKSQFTAVNSAIKQFETGSIDKQIASINSSISKLGGSANTELQSKISGTLTQVQQLKTALGEAIAAGDTQKIVSSFGELQIAMAKVKNGISEIKTAQGGNWIDTTKIEDLIRKVQQLEGVDISGIMSKLKAGLDAGAISPGDWSAITSEFKDLQAQASNVGSTAQTAGSSIKSMFAAFTAGISAVTIIHKVNSAIKDMVGNVHAVDDAMTELKKVTNETDSAYSSYLKNSASTAKELGTSISDYVNSTADFARLGNSFTDSQELAKVASVYNIVGDDLSGIDQATEHIISSMYAFGIEASNAISIVDKLNSVSNSYAISSGGLGEALARSASSLAAAGNSIDESVAIITSANTVVQDPQTVGNVLKTNF